MLKSLNLLILKLFIFTLASALVLAVQPCAAATSEDYVYPVVKGDTLIGLTTRLLRSPADWPAVARHNRLRNPNVIPPGLQLRVPMTLLNSALVPVVVTHVEGDVKAVVKPGANATLVALGASLAEGAQVVTGKDGYVTLKLADGSTVRVQSGTQVEVERMRTYPGVGVLDSLFKLVGGRVESLVQKFRPEERKETRHGVTTPVANLAVRGTEFRVTMDGQANETRGEVLAGAVAFAGEGASDSKSVNAGFGSVVDARKNVAEPVALLAAPDTAPLPKLQERTLVRFRLPELAGARAYRAQVARDENFNVVVAEILSPSPELRITDMADGGYFLRVRGVDARGLEGRDATHAFTLKARPEPPSLSLPASRGKVRAAEVAFQWAENTEAAAYHLQVARDASFNTLVHENKAVKGPQAVVGKLALGEYHWRIASLRGNGDRGPYGDATRFTLFAPPAQPDPPQVGDGDIRFRWAGEPGQKFDFQLAADNRFAQPLVARTLEQPEIEVSRPAPGVYFMRYRATDPDGFVGPYTAPQTFTVPAPLPCLRDSAGRCVAATHGIVSPLQ